MRNLLSLLIFVGLGAGLGVWVIVAAQRDLAARGLSGADLLARPPAIPDQSVELLVPESPPIADEPPNATDSPRPLVLRLNDGRVRVPTQMNPPAPSPADANATK